MAVLNSTRNLYDTLHVLSFNKFIFVITTDTRSDSKRGVVTEGDKAWIVSMVSAFSDHIPPRALVQVQHGRIDQGICIVLAVSAILSLVVYAMPLLWLFGVDVAHEQGM